jgi:RNA polymerase sigma factor (TIGR02999 family)
MASADVLDLLRSRSSESLNELVPQLYAELKEIAHRHLARTRSTLARDGTLATTALVNEAYLKLVDQSRGEWADRAHFLAVASLAMRHILVDRARAHAARKRGGAMQEVTLDDDVDIAGWEPERLIEIDDALERLAEASPRLARVVECRFYGGMSEEEIASALDMTVRTVRRDWVKARMILQQSLA